MSLATIPDNIEKIKRSQFLTFLDTTPTGNSRTWAVVGVGVNEYSISYNAQVDTEKWIVEDNARNDHASNQKQGDVNQKCYKNDPAFEFVANGRDKLNYKTHILDIDTWNGTGTGSSITYPAKMSDGLITLNTFSGALIEYELRYDRRPYRGNSNNHRWRSNFHANIIIA